MNRPERRALERVRYWQGQMLRSKDFRDIQAGEAQRRWWHNRALHEAYGVRGGLVAREHPPTGTTTAILVEPGVAYDCFGRELVLERPEIVPLPVNVTASPDPFSLVMRHAWHGSDRGRDAVCWTHVGASASGTIAFFWKPTKLFVPTDGVSLGEVTASLTNNQLIFALDPRFTPVASRAVARATLASGTTVPGNTPWELWLLGRQRIGVQTRIDTSAAGFVDRPVYFAWLQGPLWNPQTQELVPALFPSIAEDSVVGFTFRLMLRLPHSPGTSGPGTSFDFITPERFALFARQHEFYVNWIGCHCGCVNEPPLPPPEPPPIPPIEIS